MRLYLFGFIGLILILVAAIAAIVIPSTKNAASEEYEIIIPEGTGALIEAGKDPGVIPEEIRLVIGRQDVLVIENRDSVGHRIADFWIGPGETLRQEFTAPGVYQGECSIHKNAQVHIIVSNP